MWFAAADVNLSYGDDGATAAFDFPTFDFSGIDVDIMGGLDTAMDAIDSAVDAGSGMTASAPTVVEVPMEAAAATAERRDPA